MSDSWPPVCETYLPTPSQRHWSPEREMMPPAAREAVVLERIRAVMAYAYEHAPFYHRTWDTAGVHPRQIRSRDLYRDLLAESGEGDPRIIPAGRAILPPSLMEVANLIGQ